MARFMNHEPTDPATPWRGAWSKQWKWQSRSINYSRLIISLGKKKKTGHFLLQPLNSLRIPSRACFLLFALTFSILFFSLFSLKSWQCFREIKSFLDRIHLYCADELPLSFLELGWSWTCAQNLSWVQQRTPYLRTHGNTRRCRALSKTCRTIASLQRCQMPRTAGRSQIKCFFFLGVWIGST